MVETLTRRYFGSNRIVRMDNFFTSVPLAQNLYSNKLGLIGTIRSNKNEIPEAFLASKEKVINSSIFALNGPLTLVSYTPKVIHKSLGFQIFKLTFCFIILLEE